MAVMLPRLLGAIVGLVFAGMAVTVDADDWRPEDKRRFIGAIAHGDVSIVEGYLEEGMSPNQYVPFVNMPALYLATLKNQPKLVELLVRHGANLDEKFGPAQRTALHEASTDGSVECMRILLEAGANPNVRNTHNRTPMDYAVGKVRVLGKPQNSTEVIALLRRFGGE